MERENEVSGEVLKPRGRPRQPYCPDCRKAGRDGVQKMPGQGYCKQCMYRRHRDTKRADEEGISRIDAREKNYRDEYDLLAAELDEARRGTRAASAAYDRIMQNAERGISPLEMELRRDLLNMTARARGLLEKLSQCPDCRNKYPELEGWKI